MRRYADRFHEHENRPMDDFICMVEGCDNRADTILPDEDDKPFSICNDHLAEISKPLSERKLKK